MTDIGRLAEIMGFKIPLNGIMMMVLQRPVIDIIKLDKRLKIEFDYAGSMKDFILAKYGEEAARIVEKYY